MKPLLATAVGAPLCTLIAFVLVAATSTPPASANATFVITVTDGNGEGFNDPAAFTPVGGNNATSLGEARLLAFRYALDIVAECIDSPVPIEIEASFDPLACTTTGAVLGYGTSKTLHRDFINAPLPVTYYSAALANALAGVDLEPNDADIEMAFNSDLGMAGCLPTKPWYLGLDGNTLDTDFVSVVIHEVCHGLGFQTYMNTTAGTKFMGFDDRYLTYLENHFAAPADYPSMSDAQRAAGNTSDPNLHWAGPSVTAGGGALSGGVSNGHVRMHGPMPLVPGSSVHHFSNALSPNELMEATMTGDNHDMGLAVNLFDDLGWKVANKTAAAACAGAVMELAWPTGPAVYQTGGPGLSNTEWGLYITANRDIQVCSLGMKVKNVLGQTLVANIYAANGNSRGALLATGSLTVTQSARQYHYIPISASLQACQDYEVTVTVGDVVEFNYWDKTMQPLLPFDAVGGAIRVNESTYYGSTVANYLFEFALIGNAASTTDLEINDPAIIWATCVDSVAAPRGVYIHAKETTRLSSVALETNFTFSDFGRTLRANVYEANGIVRHGLVATGTRKITSFGSPEFVHIPVSVLLREGFDYDIEIEFPATTWSCWDESGGPTPFDNEPFTIINGERGGDPLSPLLGRFQFRFSPGVVDNDFDLVAPFHGPPDGSWNAAVEAGILVQALTGPVDIYSLGWRADVPAGLLLVAQIYEAPGGLRGPLLADGFIESGASGMRWHDIPVTLTMHPPIEYDIAVIIPAANSWEYWDDTNAPVVPYNTHGFLKVLQAERGGDITYTELPHFRVGGCITRLTGAGDRPVTPPSFTLSAQPNPVSDVATIHYSLEEDTPVTMTVYDVRGRRIKTLVRSSRLAAGPHQVPFDASGVAAGVYFVRMDAQGRHLTRKLVVTR